MAGIRAGRPNESNKVLDEDGVNFSPIWYRLFVQLWERSGGANDAVFTAAPVGSGAEFYGDTAPDGWFLCQGQEVSRSQYSALFVILGVTWGAGDGSTTFNLPDRRQRVGVGVGDKAGLTPRALADEFGEEDHTMTVLELVEHAHTITDPGHSHPITDPGHSHPITDPGHSHGSPNNNFVNRVAGTEYVSPGNIGASSGGTSGAVTNITINNTSTDVTVDDSSTDVTVDNTGSGDPFNVVQPSVAVNYIIKF